MEIHTIRRSILMVSIAISHQFFSMPRIEEKRTGWFSSIEDDILAIYIGFLISHYKDPY